VRRNRALQKQKAAHLFGNQQTRHLQTLEEKIRHKDQTQSRQTQEISHAGQDEENARQKNAHATHETDAHENPRDGRDDGR
jgi:hypothetical protein